MKIDYSKNHTVLFVEQLDNRNILVGIGLVENKNIQDFANNWESRERAAIKMNSYLEPEDLMDILRKEFEDIENELRKK